VADALLCYLAQLREFSELPPSDDGAIPALGSQSVVVDVRIPAVVTHIDPGWPGFAGMVITEAAPLVAVSTSGKPLASTCCSFVATAAGSSASLKLGGLSKKAAIPSPVVPIHRKPRWMGQPQPWWLTQEP